MENTKQYFINNISNLFPADSEFEDTKKIGEKLLLEAVFKNWRELPEAILSDYSRNCNFEEMNQSRITN